MEQVTGFGGLFFRATDPDALNRWYAEHLGITLAPTSYDAAVWWQERGPRIFSAFPADSDVLGRPGQAWKMNFRVRNLDAMVTQLRQAGTTVEVDSETYPNGRFALMADPEGNPIELWEPNQAALAEHS